MSDWPSTFISGTPGNVHTGSGSLVNLQLPPLTDSRVRNPRVQATRVLSWLEERFVHPAGFGQARAILADHRIVFLGGEPGSGRTTAAKMLLWELEPDADRLYELLAENGGQDAPLDLGHIRDGDRAWLDLSAIAEPDWAVFRREMPSLPRVAEDNGARLVVVLPAGGEPQPELGQYCARIERPPAAAVLRRHLRMAGVCAPDPLPSSLPFLGDSQPIRDIYEYARLIAAASSQADGDFATWCHKAERALAGWPDDIRQLVTRLEDGRQRAFLLAVAMLHGAHPDSVHQATERLLEIAEQPSDPCPALQTRALDQRLDEVGAELDPHGNVAFKRVDYDSAVRAYFWANFPQLRTTVRRWVSETVAAGALRDDEPALLAGRYAELCLTRRHQPECFSLIRQWTQRGTAGLRSAAGAVLERGLSSEWHGRAFRQQLYEWSKARDLTDSMADVIAVACRDQMAVSHPDQALVRLHHVARRKPHGGAWDVLMGLAEDDAWFFRQLLGRLAGHLVDLQTYKYQGADIELFLDLADARLLTRRQGNHKALIAEDAVRRQLVSCWAAVFAPGPDGSWVLRAAEWTEHAAADGQHRDSLLDVLISGAAQFPAVLARLYAIVRRRPGSAAIGDVVLDKITAAQGLDFG